MTAVVLAAIISTLSLEGDVAPEDGPYVVAPFEVPAGTVEIGFQIRDESAAATLDFGLEGPDGFRGWCGRYDQPLIVGEAESSRCYLTGAIEPGAWRIDIGAAHLAGETVHWTATLEFRDEATVEARPRADWAAVALEEGARWYAGDFHVHSNEGGDASATFAGIVELARERGLDFVTLSEHNTVSQIPLLAALQEDTPDLLFLRGSEVTTYGGHGTAVGNAGYVDHHVGRDGHTITDLLEEVADEGGLFIINHPRLDLGDGDFCIGCEWSYDDAPLELVAGIELQTGSYFYRPIFGAAVIEMWDAMLDAGHRVTGTGGSDDHSAPADPAPRDAQVGTPCTRVFADELSEAAILEAVRAGRVVVQLRGPDDPMVELTAETDAGEAGMIGDTLRGAEVTLTARVTGGDGLALALWRGGAEDETVTVEGDDFTATFVREVNEDGDRYRVQLGDTQDIVITNHVWIEHMERRGDGGDGCGCRSGTPGRGNGIVLLIAIAIVCVLGRRSSAHKPSCRP